MRQVSFLAAATLLTLGLGGCGFFNQFGSGGDQSAVEEVPQPVVPAPGTQPPTPTEEFAEPVVEETGAPIGNVPPDLIVSTDPNQRAANVRRDRSDPFALLPTTPTIEIPVEEQQRQQQQQQRGAAQPGGTPGALAPIPQLVPRNTTPPPPPPPRADIARAVSVSGVVQIGSVPYAIVSAPNEPHSRYVRAGQRLSNGQVLVRRIDAFPGREPVVILEENGIEVTREVTGPAEAASETAQAPANGSAI